MFGWSYPVSQDVQGWIEESFTWAMAEGILRPDTPLVLPNATFFPARKGVDDAAKIRGVADDLQRILGMEDKQIELHPQPVLPDELRHQYGVMADIGGTWMADGNRSVITYDPALIRLPLALISTLAHEMMHERLSWRGSEMPGGPEVEELSTDLHCFTAGLGVIQMAGAEQAGWQGYMRQTSRAHALALFLAVRGIDQGDVHAAVPARAWRFVKRAMREIAGQTDMVASLREQLVTTRCDKS